jgi:hypothetical protein
VSETHLLKEIISHRASSCFHDKSGREGDSFVLVLTGCQELHKADVMEIESYLRDGIYVQHVTYS